MRKILIIAAFSLGVLPGGAQEKVMNITRTDGTRTQTRVAELSQISFLTVDEGGQGLLVKTSGGETTAVLFEANPVVTIAGGKLTVKSDAAEPVEFEIADIAEMAFGDASEATGIRGPEGIACVLQDGGVLLRGIPGDVKPRVYSIDGRSIPTPPLAGGELRLSREALGTGVFIVKVGTFSAKIRM